MIWRESALGEVVRLQRGHDLPADRRQDGDVPVVSSAGITGYHHVAKAFAPGVVTGRYGTLGEVYFLDVDYWPLNTALYVTDFKGNNPRFIAYLLRHLLKDYQSDKAAIPGIDRNVLHAMTVRVPGVAIQLRVARILTGYDELIDNNRRRIKLLEDSARLLFDEWFIRGHLPPMHLQSADVGEARHFSLAHICDDVKNPVLPEQLDSDVPYIGLEHMPRRSFTLGEWGSAADISSMKLRYLAGDIVFGKIRPYFHKVGIALTDGICSSDAIVMRAKSPHWQYLLLALVSSDEFIGATAQAMKEGSKMPRADGKQMMAYPVSVPNGGVLEAFNNHVEPIIEQVKALAFQVRKLRTARDLLLPRLMSGQLSV